MYIYIYIHTYMYIYIMVYIYICGIYIYTRFFTNFPRTENEIQLHQLKKIRQKGDSKEIKNAVKSK